MSAKHRNLLAKQKIKQSVDLDGVSFSDDDESFPSRKKDNVFSFEGFGSDTSSSENDDNESQESQQDQKYVPKSEENISKKNRHSDGGEIWSLEKDNAFENVQNLTNKTHSNTFETFLSVDAKHLDIDYVIKQRFGSNLVSTDDSVDGVDKKKTKKKGRQHIIIPSKKRTLHKKLLHGNAKEHWARPVSFIGGGICMTCMTTQKGDSSFLQYFTFQWSEDYKILQTKYESIRNNGDVNTLIMFLNKYPYHLDGLLQLSSVYLKLGDVEKALDLVRRCVYHLEYSQIESFKPYETSLHCRLLYCIKENQVYLHALGRYMHLAHLTGCSNIAANIGKVVLSLDPHTDATHVLLCLDHYLISSSRYGDVTTLCSNEASVVLDSTRDGADGDKVDITSTSLMTTSALQDLDSSPLLDVHSGYYYVCFAISFYFIITVS